MIKKNATDAAMILIKKPKLGNIENESESTECYAVDSDEPILATKIPKRQFN